MYSGSFSGNSGAQGSTNDIWNGTPPLTHRRSLTFENIWSTNSNHSSISSGSGVNPLGSEMNTGSPPQQLSPQFNHFNFGFNPEYVDPRQPFANFMTISTNPNANTNPNPNTNRNPSVPNGFTNPNIPMNMGPGNPLGPANNYAMPGSRFEHRHSVNLSPTFESKEYQWELSRRHSYGELANHKTEDNATMDLINDYFETDPHKRVKVNLTLLEQYYYNDERTHNIQLPKFPIETSLRNYQLALVGFKAGRIDVFYLPSNSDLVNLKVGDVVIVEADRGRDLGKVFKLNISIDEARLLKFLQFQEQQQALNESEDFDLHISNQSQPPVLHFPKSIISLAQPNEILRILNKKQDEDKACRLCLAKITNLNDVHNHNLGDLLNMKLIDAEYQFDRNKLIFYYSTNRRIDFRDLVRELFRIYKTRIWMCAVIGIPYTTNSNSKSHTLNKEQSHPSTLGSHLFNLDSIKFSVPFAGSNESLVPRNYHPQQGREHRENGELFVLKSLVDQINH